MDKFSITGEKTVKSTEGFAQIYKSLTDKQKAMIKIIGEFQISNDNKIYNLTYKYLVDLMIDNAVVGGPAQVKNLLFEPMDHDVIVERIYNKNKKHYYKLNLSKEVIEDLISGKFD